MTPTHFPIAPYPLLGHLPQLLNDSMKFFLELGLGRDLAPYRVGYNLRYLVNHPDALREVWQNPLYERQPAIRKVLSSVLGHNLLTQEGAKHRRPRRMMQPAFHREKLGGYLEPMVRHAAHSLEHWIEGQKLDLNVETKRVALDIVGESLFSLEPSEHVRQVTSALEALLPRLDSHILFYGMLPDRAQVAFWGRDRVALETVREGLAWFVRSRRALRPQSGDLMDMLLSTKDEDGSGLTDGEVAAQALTLMSAGFETTANTPGSARRAWLSAAPDERGLRDHRQHPHLDVLFAGPPPRGPRQARGRAGQRAERASNNARGFAAPEIHRVRGQGNPASVSGGVADQPGSHPGRDPAGHAD